MSRSCDLEAQLRDGDRHTPGTTADLEHRTAGLLRQCPVEGSAGIAGIFDVIGSWVGKRFKIIVVDHEFISFAASIIAQGQFHSPACLMPG